MRRRQFQAVMEEAMEEFVAKRRRERPRPEVMAHVRASVERNRRLMELLAECVGSSRRTAKRWLCTTRVAEGEREAAARTWIIVSNDVRTLSTRPAGMPGQGAKTTKITYYPRPALLGWLVLVLALLLGGACVPQDMVVSPLGMVVVGAGEDIQIRSLEALTGIGELGVPRQRAVAIALADYGPIEGHRVSMGAGNTLTPFDPRRAAEGHGEHLNTF